MGNLEDAIHQASKWRLMLDILKIAADAEIEGKPRLPKKILDELLKWDEKESIGEVSGERLLSVLIGLNGEPIDGVYMKPKKDRKFIKELPGGVV